MIETCDRCAGRPFTSSSWVLCQTCWAAENKQPTVKDYEGHWWVDRHDGDRPVCRDCGANPGDYPSCEPAERAIERLRVKRVQKSKAVVESDFDLDDMAKATGNGDE